MRVIDRSNLALIATRHRGWGSYLWEIFSCTNLSGERNERAWVESLLKRMGQFYYILSGSTYTAAVSMICWQNGLRSINTYLLFINVLNFDIRIWIYDSSHRKYVLWMQNCNFSSYFLLITSYAVSLRSCKYVLVYYFLCACWVYLTTRLFLVRRVNWSLGCVQLCLHFTPLEPTFACLIGISFYSSVPLLPMRAPFYPFVHIFTHVYFQTICPYC